MIQSNMNQKLRYFEKKRHFIKNLQVGTYQTILKTQRDTGKETNFEIHFHFHFTTDTS